MRLLSAVLAVGFVCCGAIAHAAEAPEDLAQTAAESWLKLTDAGNSEASWDQAASMFKTALTKAQWAQALGAARPPLGKLVSRKLKSRQYLEKLPGAPDGQYVILQYDSVFEKKAAAVETITPTRDADGVWRVSGYFVR